ncbi:MAG: hypothetical protein QNK36_00350 [Colwellia sp.]|nr:hypothetical protein [Colwellia sp.]
MLNNQRPPYILVKTWLDIYYSQQTPEHKEAQVVVETLILKNFYSVYEAEIYLFRLERSISA